MTADPATRFARSWFEAAVAAALEEDLGGQADVTTMSTVPEDARATAAIRVKEPGVICGLGALEATFHALDPRVIVRLECNDGDVVETGAIVAIVSGPARAILTGERIALNLVGHLSGIATLTREFVSRAPDVEVADTRKTLPGLRALQKYAVRTGGGTNHRFALWDAVLIKDNHIAVAGGVGEATRRAVRSTTLRVQVECSTQQEVADALDAGAAALLLDNRTPDELRELVAFVRERGPSIFIEASGGITLDNVEELAASGVDRVSIGALTHSAPGLDVSLDMEPA